MFVCNNVYFLSVCICVSVYLYVYVYAFVILQINTRHFSMFALSRIEHENLNIDSPRSCDSCLNLQAKIYSLSINIFFFLLLKGIVVHCGDLHDNDQSYKCKIYFGPIFLQLPFLYNKTRQSR